MGSRLLPPALATAALAAGGAGFGGLALWLGLLAVPAAAATAFVAVSDKLEGKPVLLTATSSSLALCFIVLECAVRSNTIAGTATPPLASWALVGALLAYSAPVFAFLLEPLKIERKRPERRRRRRSVAVELEPPALTPGEIFERAA